MTMVNLQLRNTHTLIAVMLPGLRIKHLVHKNYFLFRLNVIVAL